MNRVGIRKNVIHILVESHGVLIFAAYDNFNEDSVSLMKSQTYDDDFVHLLMEEKILTK